MGVSWPPMRLLSLLAVAALAAACEPEPDGAASPASNLGGPAPVFGAEEPALRVARGGPDAGSDILTIDTNVRLDPATVMASDVGLDDTNTSASFAPTGVTVGTTSFDVLFSAGTFVSGHVYQVTVSAAHLADLFGVKLAADFTGKLTVK